MTEEAASSSILEPDQTTESDEAIVQRHRHLQKTLSNTLSETQGSLWTIGECIGGGAHGTIFSATKTVKDEIDQKVAIKVISETQPKLINNELMLLKKKIVHPHICQLFEYFSIDLNYFIVFEVLEFTLEQINNDSKWEFSELVTLNHVYRAMKYLHEHSIMHRDLKTSNVMFTKNGIVKLIDFGVAKEIQESSRQSPRMYTIWYRPPEVILGLNYSYPSDLWALGAIGVEMLWKKPLFQVTSESMLLAEICKLFKLRSITKENINSVEQPFDITVRVNQLGQITDDKLCSISCSLLCVDPNKRSYPDVNFVEEGAKVIMKRRQI